MYNIYITPVFIGRPSLGQTGVLDHFSAMVHGP